MNSESFAAKSGTATSAGDSAHEGDPALAAMYVEDRRATLARNLPFAIGLYLFCSAGLSGMEWFFRPERQGVMLTIGIPTILLCFSSLVAVRLRPRYSVAITVATVNGLVALFYIYGVLVASSGEMLAIFITLILGGVVALLPLGPYNQLLVNLPALAAYPITLRYGVITYNIPWYGFMALTVAVGVLVVGAARVDQYRRRILQQAREQMLLAAENDRLMRIAQRADATKTDFLATASHELRTPLGAIVGYTDLILDGTLSDEEEQHDALERVRRQAHVMLEMLQNLLDAEKIEAGRTRVDFEEVTVGEVLHALQLGLPPLWQKPGVAIVWDAPEASVRVRTDRMKLTTIIRNLVHNAVKYTPSGEVRIAVEPAPDGAVRLSVTDTGEGIPADDLPFVFDRFRQSKNPSRSGGLGLGLYIVRQFVAAIGAELTVESEVGRGSTFTLRLPRDGEAGAAREARSAVPA